MDGTMTDLIATTDTKIAELETRLAGLAGSWCRLADDLDVVEAALSMARRRREAIGRALVAGIVLQEAA